MQDISSVIWTIIFIVALAWIAYYLGWQRGYMFGYQEGKDEGKQLGKAEGEQAGIYKVTTERVLNSITGEKNSLLDETEKQIRAELYAKLTAKPKPPAKPDPLALLATRLQHFGWWLLATAIVALVVYLRR
jgi:hypothetical protein